jgi:hypothetical protein
MGSGVGERLLTMIVSEAVPRRTAGPVLDGAAQANAQRRAMEVVKVRM